MRNNFPRTEKLYIKRKKKAEDLQREEEDEEQLQQTHQWRIKNKLQEVIFFFRESIIE